MNTSNPYDGRARARHGRSAAARRSARITDPETGEELAPSEIGMIEVEGPNVFKGYWRMPEKTASEFRPDGFFITGDLGKIDERRLRAHRRARQGPDHHRRLQRLPEGDRGGDRRHARA